MNFLPICNFPHRPCRGSFRTLTVSCGHVLITLTTGTLALSLLCRDFAGAAEGFYGGGKYHIDGQGMYDQNNPLWRENYQYTGERRGPAVDDYRGVWVDMMRRRGRDRAVDKSAPSMVGDGNQERFSFYPDDDEWQFHHRRLEIRPSDGFSRGGSSPSSSAPSRFHSNRRGVPLERELDNDIFGTSSASSMQLRPYPSSQQSKGLSIDFQPKRGKIEVDFIGPQQDRHLPKITNHPRQSVTRTSNELEGTATKNVGANVTTNATDSNEEATESSTALTVKRGPQAGSHLVPVSQLHPDPSSNGINTNVQLSLSLDPFSTARLVHALALTCMGLVSAFVGTLRLVGPMIAAKRFLTTIGYIFYDHYNGRYIRTTYTRRMRRLQEYEIIAGLRGTGRCLLQIVCVGLAGRLVGFIMDRAPCLIRPTRICDWWYGTVWISSVYAVGWTMQLWLTSMDSSHPLSLRATPMIGRNVDTRKKGDRSFNNFFKRQKESKEDHPPSVLGMLVQVPWRVVQRMRDPEEWLTSLLRPRSNSRFYYSNMHSYSTQHEQQKPLKLDTLLFPCTWKPLRVWTCLVVVRAIGLTLTETASWNDAANYVASMPTKRSLIMRSFVLYEILHGEWKRVFVTERRVALGAFFSTVCMTALLWTIYSVAMVDGITALVLIPALVARLVSTWMNILLYYDRCGLPSSFGRSPVPSKRKILE